MKLCFGDCHFGLDEQPLFEFERFTTRSLADSPDRRQKRHSVGIDDLLRIDFGYVQRKQDLAGNLRASGGGNTTGIEQPFDSRLLTLLGDAVDDLAVGVGIAPFDQAVALQAIEGRVDLTDIHRASAGEPLVVDLQLVAVGRRTSQQHEECVADLHGPTSAPPAYFICTICAYFVGTIKVCTVVRMARANVYLPDELHARARAAGLNVSELTQQAIELELQRAERLAAMDTFLDEQAGELGPATEAERREAEAWAQAVIDTAARSARGDKKPTRSKKAKAS
jgi:hypothetical protein